MLLHLNFVSYDFTLLIFGSVAVVTSLDLSDFRLMKSMDGEEDDLRDCRADHKQVLRGEFEVN